MIQVDDQLAAALRGANVESRVEGIASYQEVDTPIQIAQTGAISFKGDGEIQASTSIKVLGDGGSLVPRSRDAVLAPFGQEVSLWKVIRLRSREWTIPLGVYRITRAGDFFEHYRGDTVTQWSVDLDLSDRFEQIRADDFLSVDAPVSSSAWEEIRRLSPIPVQEALGSAAVPAATVYESRIEGIATLAGLLGGNPHLTREGVLTARLADAWLVSSTPVFDIAGTIKWSDEVTNEFYNQIQVTSTNDASIVAYAVIDDDSNPLSVNRAGGRTYRYASPTVASSGQAQEVALSILERLSNRRSRGVTVSCGPEALLLELGDFGRFNDPVQKREVLGEVAAITVPLNSSDPIVVEAIVAEEA